MTDRIKDIRDFLFRGLLFESEADRFRAAGIRIGADLEHSEKALLEERISPFGLELRNEALSMGRLYCLIYCFENSVRDLIRGRLSEKYGADWWSVTVPTKVKSSAELKQKGAQAASWLEGQKSDVLAYVDFGDLAAIIIEKWDDFRDLIPSQHWLKQRMDELEATRHFIAHNRLLSPSEAQRIEMYISDWNKMVGL